MCCMFYVTFPGDLIWDTMAALVNRSLVMSAELPHNSLMSSTKGERSYTPSHTHATKPVCTCRHPGGPIYSLCLKPHYLLENQSCSAPGPINRRDLEQQDKSDLFSCNLLISCPTNLSIAPFVIEGKKQMLAEKPEQHLVDCLYIGINALCQALRFRVSVRMRENGIEGEEGGLNRAGKEHTVYVFTLNS